MNKLMLLSSWIFLCSFLFAQRPEGSFLRLDGDGDFMQLSDYADSLIFSGPATIEFWLRADFDHHSGSGFIWAINDDNDITTSGAESFELRYGSNTSGIANERLTVFYSLWSSNAYGVDDPQNHSGRWHHYAIVARGSEYSVYINGEEQTLTPSNSVGNDIPKAYGAGFDPKVNVALGARLLGDSPSFGFNGSIDDFRIWNVSRSLAQIRRTMSDTLSSVYYNSADSGLVGYWRFDKEENLSVGSDRLDIRDLSIHGYHGDLAGNAVVKWELFTDINVPLTGVSSKSTVWGDYDNDDDLDMILSDEIYNNDYGNFTSGSPLTELSISSSDWGDYNNDGNLDILLTGIRSDQRRYSMIYLNSDGSFMDINAGLEGIDQSSVAWGDYDNDGDLDILMTGYSSSGNISKIYRNDGSSFTDIGASLRAIADGSVAWGDYDNDGDLDILLGEYNTVWIYRNDDSTFTENDLHITDSGSSVWGDYDNDGDLDILIASAVGHNKIYCNDENTFNDIDANIGGGVLGSAAWGDFDNDGDLDILITDGIYRNDDSLFTEIVAPLDGSSSSSASWGDYDIDGDLDILLTDYNFSRIYRNNNSTPNTPPDAPVNLSSTTSNTMVTLSWDTASDAQTPSPGLTYNLRIGTTPGGSEVMSPMAGRNGYRRVVQMGNVNHNLSWQIKNLQPNTTYFWSVQAVDNSFAGGTWAEEETFTTGTTGITNSAEEMPARFSLAQNYPNPFNPRTVISWQLPISSQVELSIYNILGQRVTTLVNKKLPGGKHTVEWNAGELPSGFYYYRIKAGEFTDAKKMLLIK